MRCAPVPTRTAASVLGEAFAEALSRKDFDGVASLLHPEISFRGHNADGPFVVEQQAYLEVRDGRIGWMRVLCSGFRPRSAADGYPPGHGTTNR